MGNEGVEPNYGALSVHALSPRDDATQAVQFAVIDSDGQRIIYGDQQWVASGKCIIDGSHPNSRIQRRRIQITYGPWEDV